MNLSVDIDEVEKAVHNPDFIQFLSNNTVDFAVAAFILDTLLKKIDEIKTTNEEEMSI